MINEFLQSCSPGSVPEKELDALIDSIFDAYIRPFHKNYGNSSSSSSSTGIRTGNFRTALLERDLNKCVICFSNTELEGAHIMSHKSSLARLVAHVQSALFKTGIDINAMQNGLCLCMICHTRFDKLEHYIDITDKNQPVVRLVNKSKTNDPNDKDYKLTLEKLQSDRQFYVERDSTLGNRRAVEDNGDMKIYFQDNDPSLQPNKTLLEFHKIACLIWRLAGGAEPVDYDSYDEDEFVDGVKSSDFSKEKLEGYVGNWISTSATVFDDSLMSRAVE